MLDSVHGVAVSRLHYAAHLGVGPLRERGKDHLECKLELDRGFVALLGGSDLSDLDDGTLGHQGGW